MKVGIVSDSIDNGPVSIGNYTEALVKQLLEEDNIELILIHSKNNNNPIYERAREIVVNNKYDLLKFCNKEKIEILHIPHLAGAWAPPLNFLFNTNNKKYKLILTLHGVAPLVLPPKLYYEGRANISQMITLIQTLKWKLTKNKFNLMITVSRSEKYNISKKLNILEEKIKVIYHGVDRKNFKVLPNKHKIKNELHLKYKIEEDDFILHVSSYQPKKNVEGVIKAFKKLKEQYDIDKTKLLIIGKQPNHLKTLAKELGLEKDIILVGYISYKDLPKFYNLAKAFVFPSFHESFGMPILEAMACGCPVITSNIFSMSEIAEDAAILVNPYKVEDIANAIYTLILDESLRRKLRQKGLKRAKQFTWEKCAKEHTKVYEEALDT